MRNPGGYGVYIGGDLHGGKKEVDTFTCAHTNKIVEVPPFSRPEDMGGLCKVCMGLICKEEVGKGCTPFLKRLDQVEKADIERRRSYGG